MAAALKGNKRSDVGVIGHAVHAREYQGSEMNYSYYGKD
jgi:hypothetical protein